MGDKRCCPYYYYESYFNKYNCLIIDLAQLKKLPINSDDFVIIGGGGILNWNSFWNNCINFCLTKTKNVIIWGAGYNMLQTQINFEQVKMQDTMLVGIRDYLHPHYNFLPCVTCKSIFFNQQFKIKRQVGIVKHFNNGWKLPEQFAKYDVIVNDRWIYDIVKFIGQSEYVISDSYHALYWASLLGKKTGRLNNYYSSRFKYCMYQYTKIENEDDLWRCNKCQLTENDLQYFRSLNDLFFDKVKKILQ